MNTSNSHVNQSFLGALLLFFTTPSTSFTVNRALTRHKNQLDPLASSCQQRKRIRQPSVLQLAISPMDPIEYSIRLVEDLEPEMLAGAAAPPSAGSSSSQWLSSSSSVLDLSSVSSLKPAMGHTQPLWGPPDPYLSAGKSIAPSARALIDLGVADPTATGAAAPPDTWPKLAQHAVQNGVRVLDSAALRAEHFFPGFTPTGGILSTHSAPLETPATFAAQVEWSAGFLNVVDKLPEAAFVYCLVEFFFLRPGIDRYTEDVELEPTRALTESVAVTGVRLGMFCLVAAVTTTIFG